jgi:hypothetical protein
MAAISYLAASGATAISVIETETGCTFRIGTKLLARSVAIFWIMEVDAKPVVALARKIAGKGAGGNAAISALHQAAADIRATLTAHSVAISRAANAAARIEEYIDNMHARGAMREFTKGYKVRRLAAKQRGENFMTYRAAELRLRRALVPLLVSGQGVGPVQALFSQVFNP